VKSSGYNVFIPGMDSQSTILFNTLYGSISQLDPHESPIARSLLDGIRPDESTRSLFSALVSQKHLVNDSVNEIDLVEARKRAGIRDSNRLDVIVLPTLNCNFACVYCYEDHRRSRMHPDMVGALKAWLTAEIPIHKVVMLHWFGGEPLLQFGTVVSVSQHAKLVAEQNGTLAVLHITTNGYLLTRNRAQELTRAGIHDFQITIDGPAKEHDKMRILTDGGGTFQRVFENVCSLAYVDDQVKVTLRINFNHNNLKSIPELLELFPPAIRPQLRVVFEPIFGDCSLSAISNVPSSELSQKISDYSEYAASLGYDITFGLSGVKPGKLIYCYAEREHQYIINFDGNVFKCSVGKFSSEGCVGRLLSDGRMERYDSEWAHWTSGELFSQKCYSCAYLPMCMGGCRKMRMQEDPQQCALVATNASYLLKQVAFGGLQQAFRV
jgi:uncharacterized protein